MKFLEHVLRFGRELRARNLPVSAATLIDLCRGLECIDIGRRADLHAAAGAIIVTRQEQLEIFDHAFRAFWDGIAPPTDGPRAPSEDDDGEPGAEPGQEANERNAGNRDADANPDADDPGEEAPPEFSDASLLEVIRRKDFSALSRDETELARRAIAALARRFASYRGRRLVSGNDSARLDMRRMFRNSIPYGLMPFKPSHLQRKEKRPRLVLLCDVSGSMQQYSSFLIQFICALRLELCRVEIGIFATQLKMISRQLDRRHIARSISRLSREDTGWGGGTNIGASLQAFSRSLPGRNLHRRTVIVILSDGWDRGDAALLQEQMQHLRQAAHKLIWLNPLLGRDRYEPLCQGMRTALPYLDCFLPAHNLASLEHVARVIGTSMR